jgi:hypothetical protein
MIVGRYFITPHAVRQFIARIAPQLGYEAARAAIIEELAHHVRAAVRLSSGAVSLRCRGGRYTFRAIVSGESEGVAPAVVTILRGDGGRSGAGARRRRRLADRRPSATGGPA